MKFKKKQLSKMISDKNKIFAALLVLVIISISGLSLLGKGTYSVDEESDKLVISCPESTLSGTTIECSLTINSVTMKTLGISGKYSVTEGLQFVKLTSVSWRQTASSEDGFVLVNLDGVRGSNLIGKVQFTIPTDAVTGDVYRIELVDVTIGDGEETTVELDNVSSEVTVYSIDFNNNVTVDNENKHLKYLPIGTTVSNFLENYLITEADGKIYDRNNNLKGNNELISSGDILKITVSNVLLDKYSFSVNGDPSGDGDITGLDLSIMRKHLVGWIIPGTNEEFQEVGVYKEALDINGDGEITGLDLSVMRKTIVGLI